jgi:chromate reductase
MKILGLCANLRQNSCNKGLLRCAMDYCVPHLIQMEMANLNLPLFNADLISTLPDVVKTFRHQVESSDALLFASSEFPLGMSFGVAAPLKNALDWGALNPNVFEGKAALIMGAGARGGLGKSSYHLRQLCIFLGIDCLDVPDITVSIYEEPLQFDLLTGEVIDQQLKKKIGECVNILVQHAQKVQLQGTKFTHVTLGSGENRLNPILRQRPDTGQYISSYTSDIPHIKPRENKMDNSKSYKSECGTSNCGGSKDNSNNSGSGNISGNIGGYPTGLSGSGGNGEGSSYLSKIVNEYDSSHPRIGVNKSQDILGDRHELVQPPLNIAPPFWYPAPSGTIPTNHHTTENTSSVDIPPPTFWTDSPTLHASENDVINKEPIADLEQVKFPMNDTSPRIDYNEIIGPDSYHTIESGYVIPPSRVTHKQLWSPTQLYDDSEIMDSQFKETEYNMEHKPHYQSVVSYTEDGDILNPVVPTLDV